VDASFTSLKQHEGGIHVVSEVVQRTVALREGHAFGQSLVETMPE
jgi:hypothetical protein